jgi:streptogramin lyase
MIIPAPIVVLPLRDRTEELPKIVDDYSLDDIAAFLAPADCFTSADRTWILEHASGSLSEIEKATLRLVALRASRNMSTAAARLDMAPVSLARWFARRSTYELVAKAGTDVGAA